MKLRVKDLQHFLAKRRINIKACVEKKDLVELVLQHSGVSSPSEESSEGGGGRVPPVVGVSNSNSWEDEGIRVSDQVPLERGGNFPQSYVESSHRREWFQEKFGPGSDSNTPNETEQQEMEEDEVKEQTNVEIFNPNDEEEVEEESTPVEDFLPQASGADLEWIEADEVISVVVEESTESSEETVITNEEGEDDIEDAKAIDEEVEQVEVEDISAEEASAEGAVGGRNIPKPKPKVGLGAELLLGEHGIGKTPNSPRRFANQGMVYLSEIQSVEDLRELSSKQVKELLAMNRVNFKGCVERDELLKILERLWKQEKRYREEGESMDDDSLCKICMDLPIDCVMLECGHMCTCTNCGKQMAECPICRQYVVRVVKTFKA